MSMCFKSSSNTGTVSNVNTLVGGSGADTITLNTAVTNGSIDLGAGNDTLTFANGSNAATLANVETAIGGTGSDTFVLTGTTASTVIGGGGINFITGNSGADTFVFDQNGTGNSTIMNFSAARGDLIGLDTTGSSTLTNNPFDLGGVSLTNSVDIAMVADNAALLAKTLSNGSKGGFAYEQDTGGLYYSGTGHFSGGGTLVGIVTSMAETDEFKRESGTVPQNVNWAVKSELAGLLFEPPPRPPGMARSHDAVVERVQQAVCLVDVE